MSAAPHSEIDQPVLLFDIPWTTYEGILEALGERRWRHTYQRGTLEIFRPLVHQVDWETYEAILRAFGDRHFRHTYAEGTLEMMSPSEKHEWLKRLLGRLIEMAAFELDIPVKSVGSTTRKNELVAHGLEPDESYYVQHESAVRGATDTAAEDAPPPDLVVEVEITHKVLDRLDTYAKLGVGEVWRYRDDQLTFFLLGQDAQFQETDASCAFPLLRSADIQRFLRQAETDDENTVLHAFVAWLRERAAQSDS